MLFYLSGILITWTVLLIWFYSPAKITLGNILFKEPIFSQNEFDTIMLFKNQFIGKLLSCYICFSFWTSLATGLALYFIFKLPWFFPVATTLTYPALCILYKIFLDKNLK